MEVEETLRSVGFVLVRFSSFAANALVFGAVPILLLVARPSFARLTTAWDAGRRRLAARFEGMVQAALVASATATVVGLVLQVTLVAEFREGEFDRPSLAAVLETSFGQWYLVRLPLLAGLAVLLVGKIREWSLAGVFDGERAPGRLWWAAWGGLGVALMATSTFSGHAAVASPRALALTNDVVHLVSGATWFTGIIVLAVVLPDAWAGRGPGERIELLGPAVMRFSRVALASIAVVGATGIVNSLLHVREVSDLVETGYGRALTIKVLLFAVILAMGAVNHLYLRHRLQKAAGAARSTPAQSMFRKTIAVELAVAICLMGMTGILTGQARTRDTPRDVEVVEPVTAPGAHREPQMPTRN